MDNGNTALAVAIVALFAAVLGPTVAGIISLIDAHFARQAAVTKDEHDHNDALRKEHQANIQKQIDDLIALRVALASNESEQGRLRFADDNEAVAKLSNEQDGIRSRAIGILLVCDDPNIHTLALDLSVGSLSSGYWDVMRSIDQALTILGKDFADTVESTDANEIKRYVVIPESSGKPAPRYSIRVISSINEHTLDTNKFRKFPLGKDEEPESVYYQVTKSATGQPYSSGNREWVENPIL